jgi:DNA-directed RNA polymerase subunit RPC12/RpoP
MGDDEKPDASERRNELHYEFECPDCNAHNPYEDGFREGSEITCFYCGTNYLVKKREGRFKFSAT